MNRFLIVLAALVASIAVAAPVASAGAWMGIAEGKAAIKDEVAYYAIGTRFAMKVDLCDKPAPAKVSCYWQSRQLYGGSWAFCYGTATATATYAYVTVKLRRGWIDDCYMTTSRPSFL